MGPLVASSPPDNTPAVQLFLTLLAAPMLLLAALVQERRQVTAPRSPNANPVPERLEWTGNSVCITDLANEVAAVNPSFSAMTGYGEDELATINPREFLHLDELQRFDAYLARDRSADPGRRRGPVCVQGRTTVTFRTVGETFSYRGQAHVLSVVRDVTEREQSLRLLEQKVVERTRELSTMLEISNTVASNLELKPLLRVVFQQLQSVFGCTGATIFDRERKTSS